MGERTRVPVTDRSDRHSALTLVRVEHVHWGVQFVDGDRVDDPIPVVGPPGQHEATARRLAEVQNGLVRQGNPDATCRWHVVRKIETPWERR